MRLRHANRSVSSREGLSAFLATSLLPFSPLFCAVEAPFFRQSSCERRDAQPMRAWETTLAPLNTCKKKSRGGGEGGIEDSSTAHGTDAGGGGRFLRWEGESAVGVEDEVGPGHLGDGVVDGKCTWHQASNQVGWNKSKEAC